MNKRFHLIIVTFLFFSFSSVKAQNKIDFTLKNQISGWSIMQNKDPWHFQLGARYIPIINVSKGIAEKGLFDAEIAINTYGNFYFKQAEYQESNKEIDPYRMWIRFSTPRLEIRAGLQKINFGSAAIFRPLMWFDQMDFRDPLQLTNGVYGLLGRYYFPKNVNVWVWILRGNNKTKGWEIVPSKKKLNEYGGRFQVPLFTGEIAASYHNRQANYAAFFPLANSWDLTYYPENMLGIDGKWDIGVGLWVEFVHKQNHPDNIITTKSENYYNVGMDYTFPIGNGLNVTTEFFYYTNNADTEENQIENKYSAFVVNYPFGISNTISTMLYYDYKTKDWFRFANLAKEYDYWSFYLMAYWNPNKVIYESGGGSSAFTGKGIQLMAIVNF